MSERLNDVFVSPQPAPIELRDWFAGMAMQGLCASVECPAEEMRLSEYGTRRAYEIADAMLAERERKATP